MAYNNKDLSLPTRKNLREFEPSLNENLAKISAATGKQWTFDCDYVALDKAVNTLSGYENRVGELIYSWALGELAGVIENLCKDDMVKEAFLDKATKAQLSYVVDEDIQNYNETAFVDGVLVVKSKTYYLSSVSGLGSDIEAQL